MVLHLQLGLRSTDSTSNTFKYDEHYLKLDTFRLCHVSVFASASKKNEVQLRIKNAVIALGLYVEYIFPHCCITAVPEAVTGVTDLASVRARNQMFKMSCNIHRPIGYAQSVLLI
jgi:hypothetical protein